MDSLQDKVAVITGAGSGIGRATALLFARLGAEVLAIDVDQDRVDRVADEIKGGGGRAQGFQVDVSDRKAMQAFSRAALQEKGRVDVLVNNAGVGVGGELKDMRLEDWEWLIGVNYWGVVYGIHFFLPAMIERRSGHIVNVASANGLFSMPFEGIYSSSKFAIVGLSETLRAELTRFRVGVTTVCPGMTNTTIMRDARMTYGSESGKDFLNNFQRLLETKGADPSRLARAIVKGVLKNQAMVRSPFHVVAVDWIHRFAPGLYRKVIAEVSKRKG